MLPPGLPALRLRRPRTTWLLVTAVAELPSKPSMTPLPPPRPSGRPTEITAGSSFSVTARTAREYVSSSGLPSRELAERFSKISIRYLYRTAGGAPPGRTARHRSGDRGESVLAFADGNVSGPCSMPIRGSRASVKARPPLTRLRSPDGLVLLLSAAAVILLLPL